MMTIWPFVLRRALELAQAERDQATTDYASCAKKLARLAERYASLAEQFRQDIRAERERYDQLAREALAMKRQGFDHVPEAIQVPEPLELPQEVEDAIDAMAPHDDAVRRHVLGYALAQTRRGIDPETLANEIRTGADVDAIVL